MSQKHPYRGNGPTDEMAGDAESDDLKAIRRDLEMHKQSEELWQYLYPDGDTFHHEFEAVALAAQDWEAATPTQRFRALRVLVRRFGKLDTFRLALLAAPKSMQEWSLKIRKRKRSEKSDGGKRDEGMKRDHWDYVISKEVYSRMKAGESKDDAIAAVKEDYRTGAPYASSGLFPPLNRPVRHLPERDGIEKWLNRFRRKVEERGYVDPYAASGLTGIAREPDLKVADIPKRGRPRKK